MALLINDKWQIVMDKYNYILQRKCVRQNKETGENEVTWSSVAYCRDLEHCCNYFMERHIKTAVDWPDLLNKIAEVKSLISNICKGAEVPADDNDDWI